MKLTIDTSRDNPRLVRAAIAMVLAALDDGTALPVGIPAGTILTDNEAKNAGFGSGPLATQPAASVAPPPPPPPVSASAGGSAPPPPPAPSGMPPAPPAGVSAATDRDSEGLPWDSRIHSGSHAKIANGTWKLAKGMSLQPAKVEGVKAELRALMALPAPAAAVPPPPPVTAQPAPPPPPPAATSPLTSAPTGTSTAGPNDNPATFPEFMSWVAGLIASNRWTHQHTTQALGTLGMQSAVNLSARPDLIPSAVQVIKSMLPA